MRSWFFPPFNIYLSFSGSGHPFWEDPHPDLIVWTASGFSAPVASSSQTTGFLSSSVSSSICNSDAPLTPGD